MVDVPRLLSGLTRIATRTLDVGPSNTSFAVVIVLMDLVDIGVVGLEAITLQGLEAIIFQASVK